MAAGKKGIRADVALVERGLAESRTRAQAFIMAGLVYSGEQRINKPGEVIAPDRAIELRGQDHPWVSRGGVKLAHGLAHFGLSPEGRVCMDLGSSTGGFTDVLLTQGAAHVYAVDVGHGQLAWKLRNDPRVTVMERVNARHLTALPPRPGAGEEGEAAPLGVLVCDASFIGLRVVLPASLALCRPGAWAVALIKPQFEVGPAIAKGGVVRDAAVHERVCGEISAWWAALPGWRVLGVEASPILGPEGNREFLIAAERDPGL
ncbi:TlyA family RNA methyltransferase [Roseococcus sp. SYP-B2431]|uniref:TlyA family RNA methyltransferase n=1 Tax=Roseococcus sp. SYP-B2431 TaxID=2496640 RepID=UPI00103C525F|nr:TlyA family RNA methyltransferase [Roseococcus sp. SYP-B2431]TCH99557.1 TlyA family RNA methyltransferase [Roseococcus sp. SYP-B2431]